MYIKTKSDCHANGRSSFGKLETIQIEENTYYENIIQLPLYHSCNECVMDGKS